MKSLVFTKYGGFYLEYHNESITHLVEGWSCQQEALEAF